MDGELPEYCTANRAAKQLHQDPRSLALMPAGFLTDASGKRTPIYDQTAIDVFREFSEALFGAKQ